jgi:DNA repair exonuclease SbcCD ATPase subunit
MDYQTFTNSILFSQGNGAGRFAVATDKEKKEILENLVNLEIYAKAQDVAKDRVKAQDAKILEKKREMERSNWELAQVDTLEQQDVKNFENTKNVLMQAELEVKSQQAQLTAYSEGSAEGIERTKKLIAALENKRDTMATADLSSETANVADLQRGVNSVVHEISKVDFRKAELVKQYKQIELNTNCPVCGSPLDAQHREQELDSIKNQLREVLMQRKLLDKQYETVNEFYQKTKADLEVKQEAVANINNDYRVILQAIQKHQKVLSDHDNVIVTLQSRVDSAIRTLEGLKRVPEPIDREQERITLRDKIKAQKGELLALEKEKAALEDVVKVYSNAGVKSHVLDLITPFLNTQGNTYLNALAGPDMELKFSTQTQNKNGEMSDKFDVSY